MNKDILMIVHNNTHSTSRIFRNIELVRRNEVSEEIDKRLSNIEIACTECRQQVDTLYEISKTLYTEEQVREAIDMARESMFEFNEKIPTSDEIIQSLKQPKKD